MERFDRILGIDPGVSTGFADFHRATGKWYLQTVKFNPVQLYNFLYDWCYSNIMSNTRSEEHPFGRQECLCIVCELFSYRPVGKYTFGQSTAIPKVDLTAREVMGIVKLAAEQRGVQIVWTMPADVNGKQGPNQEDQVFWTDEKVKALGLYRTGSAHEMDATKHVLQYRSFRLMEENLFRATRTGAPAFGEVLVPKKNQ